MDHVAEDEGRRKSKHTVSKRLLLTGVVVALVGIAVIGYCKLKADTYDKTFDRFYGPELGTGVCLYLPGLKMNKGWTRLPHAEVRGHVVYLDDRPDPVGLDLTGVGPEEAASLVKEYPQAARCIALEFSLLKNDNFLDILKSTAKDYLVLTLPFASIHSPYSPENIGAISKLDRCPLYLPHPVEGASDEVLSHLAKCKRIEMLKISGVSRMTDVGMQHIGEMAQLRCLEITTSHPNVTYLDTPFTERPAITSEGIAQLKRCRKLQELTLAGVKVAPEAAKAISRLSYLQELSLCYTDLSDESLRHIANMGSLKRLYLSNNPLLSDSGIEFLSDLRLWVLTLSGTSISDTGLEHIMGMDSLIEVSVSNTQVTGKGIQKFNQAMNRD